MTRTPRCILSPHSENFLAPFHIPFSIFVLHVVKLSARNATLPFGFPTRFCFPIVGPLRTWRSRGPGEAIYHCRLHALRNSIPERRFSSKISKMIKNQQKFWSYGSGSDRSTRNRQNTQAHFDSKAPLCTLRVTLSNENKSSTNSTTVHVQVLLEPPPYIDVLSSFRYIWPRRAETDG